MNIAHIAYYANLVLAQAGIETLTVAFWRGLYEGAGDISSVPDYLIEAEATARHKANIDRADTVTMQFTGVHKAVKRIWVGGDDGYWTFWDPQSYDEVYPDEPFEKGGV